MRRFLIGLCILVGGVYACQRVDNESVCGVLYTQEVDTSLVKKYVYENRFIDIDIYAVARYRCYGSGQSCALPLFFSCAYRTGQICVRFGIGKRNFRFISCVYCFAGEFGRDEHWCTGDAQTRYGTGSSCDRRGISPIFVTIKKAPVFYRCLCTYFFSNRAATQLFFSKCFL